ncbi:MAG TPA: hypothetical protein VF511_06675, partial [Chthoniobacterales bacterium]
WKAEGRLIRSNEIRPLDEERWITAGEFPEIFADEIAPPLPPPPRTLRKIISESVVIYLGGFRLFLVLALLTALPSFCAQLSAPTRDMSSATVLDPRNSLALLFSFFMLLLSLAMWPLFIAGIQVASSEVMAGRRLGIFELLRRALAFWPRLAMLCLFVYGNYLLWTVVPVFFMLVIALGTPSLIGALLVLALLGFQVWMTARLFRNFLFWQQAAVIANCDVNRSLLESRQLGQSGGGLPWYSRPLWRGGVLASIWCAFALAVWLVSEWHTVEIYFQQISTQQDPQALLQAASTASERPATPLSLGLGLLQIVLRPWLGISFVVLYYDTIARLGRRPEQGISSN